MKKRIVFLFSILAFYSCEKQDSFLKDYVNKDDSAFRYEIKKVVEGQSWKEYIIHMVSQKWLTDADVNEVEWWHWLTIVIPNDVKETEALLFIGGGDQEDEIPQSANPASIKVALATK